MSIRCITPKLLFLLMSTNDMCDDFSRFLEYVLYIIADLILFKTKRHFNLISETDIKSYICLNSNDRCVDISCTKEFRQNSYTFTVK